HALFTLLGTSLGLLSKSRFYGKGYSGFHRIIRPSLLKPAPAALEFSFGRFETVIETRRILTSWPVRSGSAASSPGLGDLA
ncbi:MAG: hypothetical protein J0J02_01505, partial [Thiobacillus sp.]|nr:hypothetical protein [Thiobacillus sp.]